VKAKKMTQQKSCRQCGQRYSCQDVYRHLASNDASSLVSRSIIAFLLPIAVFIVSLVVLQELLDKAINSKAMITALSFLLALLPVFVYLLIIKKIRENFYKHK
jgi:uncharacterized membrane protein YoaK (UPF0700 family)